MHLGRTFLALLVLAPIAHAGTLDPKSFMQTKYEAMRRDLKEGKTASFESMMDTLIDDSEMMRRSFGEPCPTEAPCTNHWATFDAKQREELQGLVRQVVHKNFKNNMQKTLDFDVAFQDVKKQKDDFVVKSEAKSKTKPRDPSVTVQFVLRPSGDSYRLVDIVTEGSAMTKNYYQQFHKMLVTEGQGYPYVVKKLRERVKA